MGICKRIPAEKKSVSSASRARNLANYITNPQLESGLEKCIWSGSKGFLSNTHEGRIAEMISLAGESKHSKDPLDHWMISLHDDEKFSQEQAVQAVDIFLRHTGLEGHQVIWGVHDDTKNQHIHVSVNRVNPETLLVEKINKGFNKEAGQQVIALIEHAQGWKSEKGARYTIINGLPVMTKEAAKVKAKRMAGEDREQKQPRQKARDMEVQTGERSVQRVGIEQAAPIIKQATSWKELHAQLAQHGMKYERKGSGALVIIGSVPVKASGVDRAAALGQLEKRLGPYQPSQEISKNDYHHHRAIDRNQATQQNLAALGKEPGHHLQNLSERRLSTLQEGQQAKRAGVLSLDAQPDRLRNLRLRRDSGRGAERGTGQPIKQNQPGWKEYQVIRAEHKANKSFAVLEMRKQHDTQRDALFEKHKAERAEIFTPSWRGSGLLRNAMLSTIATKQAAEKLMLQEQQRADRKDLHARYQLLPTYKEWKEQPLIVSLKVQSKIDQNITRDQQPPQLSKMLLGMRQSVDLRGYFTYRLGDTAIFRDEGKTLAVLDQSSQSIAAALAVAQQKYGQTLTLTGNDAFKRRAVASAVQYGLTVKFEDPTFEALRVKMIEDKRQAERQAQAERTAAAEREAQAALTKKEEEKAAALNATQTPDVALASPNLSSPEARALDPVLPASIEINVSAPVPALSCAEWIAQQTKPQAEPQKSGDGKVEFVVAHIADFVVLDHGRTVAIHPLPSFELRPGQRVVIAKDGSLLLAPERRDLGAGKGGR